MHVNSASYQEESQLVHCLARTMCPLGQVCAASDSSGGSPLFPMVATLEPGEELWADARFEQRVYVIRGGVFACMPNTENTEACTAALYGCGDSFGLVELYSGRDVANMYHMRALTQACVCSAPARTLRRKLEAMDPAQSQQITSTAFMNTSCAMYFQSRVIAQIKAADRIHMLLGRIAQLARRSDERFCKIALGQADLALLADSDRMSAGRALHQLEEHGLVRLGYRSIELLEPFFKNPHPELLSLAAFRSPGQ